MKHTLPNPIPALLSELSRLEGTLNKPGADLQKMAFRDLLACLEVPQKFLKSWVEIPIESRERVSKLAHVLRVHWERPEHDLFREALTNLTRNHGKLDTSTLDAVWRDPSVPRDRQYLAVCLVHALHDYWNGRPLAYRWAVPLECVEMLVTKKPVNQQTA